MPFEKLLPLNSMLEHKLNKITNKADIVQLFAVLILMIIGVMFIASAKEAEELARQVPWYNRCFTRQIVWYCIGFGVATFIYLLDYNILARWALLGYWMMILLLLCVLVFGSVRFGARRWFDLGPIQFQPSEFAKIALIFLLAHYLSRPKDELNRPDVFWKCIGLIVLPFILIMKEPDLGSALVLWPIGLAMMLAAGAPAKQIFKLLVGGTVLISIIIIDVLFAPPKWQIKLEDYQKRRLMVYFGKNYASPDATPEERRQLQKLQLDDSYNIRQALISVGSGGLTGKGWKKGTQSSLGYLPRAVAHNDFIFSVIAEEKGFLGSVLLITTYLVVIFCCLRIAGQARDRLGKLLAVGVAALFFSHVFINIGMNIRMMPVTGIPLPFVSYGGTSVLSSWIAIGIAQSVYLHRRSY